MRNLIMSIILTSILFGCGNRVKFKNENSSITETTSFSNELELSGSYRGATEDGYSYEQPTTYSASIVYNGNNEKGNHKNFTFTLFKDNEEVYSQRVYTFSSSQGEMLWAETGQNPKIFYFLKVEDGVIKITLSDVNKNHLLKLEKTI